MISGFARCLAALTNDSLHGVRIGNISRVKCGWGEKVGCTMCCYVRVITISPPSAPLTWSNSRCGFLPPE
ncbi:Uncharacterized protein HZ326_25233 [Fusarium oxysporum f. sp. albedinis]|nr:Uncharacterized protein HZ326_25233 [Fusarium oxysporum f. sp. albedinis]